MPRFSQADSGVADGPCLARRWPGNARGHRYFHGGGRVVNSARRAFFVLIAAGFAATACGSSSGMGASPVVARDAALTQPSCRSSIHVSNLGINSTAIYKIRATWTSCGASWAFWDMKQGNQWFGYWTFPPSPQYQSYYPGYTPLGRFNATPTGAWRGSGYVPQNGSAFSVKLNSRITFQGYRSGRNVFMRALVTRYNPSRNWGSGGWQVSVNRRVVFEERSGTRWMWRGARNTGRNGYTPYARLNAPTRRQFRATVQEIATMWGRVSGVNSR